jgi:N-carbamoylputrescine amidase
MKKVQVAAIQMKMSANKDENVSNAYSLAKKAADDGANIILLPELFENLYFCQERNYSYYSLAEETEKSQTIKLFSKLAMETKTVIPVSFFEKSKNVFFNSVAMIDATGEILGVYRKTHIPDDHFYQEKFYFSPGNTGFKVFDTYYGRVGVGICWDQWFPESARCMAVKGAQILLYPTAIGSEPILEVDSKGHWQRCMQGHAAANIMPVVAANRVGKEIVTPTEENQFQNSALDFYGSSFISDHTGKILKEMDRVSQGYIIEEFDFDMIDNMRTDWGVFRDRRPEHYEEISKLS